MKYFDLEVAGLKRSLPIIRVTDSMEIASFVILGDAEISIKAAEKLAEKLPEFDVLITAEA
jgi:adenine phosphoribosyltransferase